MMNDYLIPLENETFDGYRLRVYKMKQLGTLDMTWTDIADMFDEVYGIRKDESKWRKEAKELLISDVENVTSEEESIKEDLRDLILEYKKERVKISDERIQNNAYIRKLSREETLLEIADRAAKTIGSMKFLPEPIIDKTTNSNAEAIAMLSDWHYGIDVHNYWNKFNPEICRERVHKYLSELVATCNRFDVQKIHLVNLSDLIAGRIHNTIRLESREDVISQTIAVSEILSEVISSLICRGFSVEYYDCLDNHSRLEPNKSDSLDLESLARIIPWYLNTRFKNNAYVNININEYSDDIITFDILDGLYRAGAVHGHRDKPGQVVKNLTLMTKEHFDLILTAHLHHFSADETNETLVISNGSLMGTDTYAKDLRLSSRASQNIIIATTDSVADYIRRVPLN